MKLSYTEKFLIAIILLILIKFLMSHSGNFSVSNSVSQKNLGMTFTDFKGYFYSKALANDLPQFSLYRAKIDDVENGYMCTFDCEVVMGVEVDKQTDSIIKISVAAQPFKKKTKDETTALMLNQSAIFSLAAMVFSPKMENQALRELFMKKLLKDVNDAPYIMDNMRYKSLYLNETLFLVIEPE